MIRREYIQQDPEVVQALMRANDGWDSGDSRLIKLGEAQLRRLGHQRWFPVLMALAREPSQPEGLGTIAADLAQDLPRSAVKDWWSKVKVNRELLVLMSVSKESLGASETANELVGASRRVRMSSQGWGLIHGVLEAAPQAQRSAIFRRLIGLIENLNATGMAFAVAEVGAGGARWLLRILNAPPAKMLRVDRYSCAMADLASGLMAAGVSQRTAFQLLKGNRVQAQVAAYMFLWALKAPVDYWRVALTEKINRSRWLCDARQVRRAVVRAPQLDERLRRRLLRHLDKKAPPLLRLRY